MQSLFQSAFLQSLGFAIANSLWQTALVWILYLLLSHVFRVSSATKYRMAVVAQCTSFIWFVITIQFYYSQYTELLRNSSALVPSSQNVQAVLAGDQGFTSQLIRFLVKAEQVLPYISMAYLVLIVFLCIRLISGYRQTQLIRTQGLQKISADWRLFIKRIASQLGIRKDIRLFLSENITTPLTVGFLKPVILIPVASINHLSTAQLEAVLLHELAHIKRYDYIVNIILSAVEISLFFNPFTQLLSKSIRKERENSCDDWVLQFQYKASDYAEALLRLACMQQTPVSATAGKPALVMTATGKKNELLIRVKRMIGEKENRFNYRRQLMALVMVTAMLGSIAWLNPSGSAHENKQAASAQGKPVPVQQKQAIAVEPMSVKVDNPLFNPVFFLSEPLKKEMEKNLASARKEIEALVVPGVDQEKALGSIPPMVANALEKASLAFEMKSNKLETEIAHLEEAKKSFEKFTLDSFAGLKDFSFKYNDELVTSWNDLQASLEKAKDEVVQLKQIKKQEQFNAKKIKDDIHHAMGELAKLDLDKLISNSLEMAALFSEKESRLKEKETKKSPARKTEEPQPKKTVVPEIPAGLFREIVMPDIRIDGESMSVNGIHFTPSLLKELSALGMMMQPDVQKKLSPEMRKDIFKKFELLFKKTDGNNKPTNTLWKEEHEEEKDEKERVIRM
jgi:bla regulator protein BlaR1